MYHVGIKKNDTSMTSGYLDLIPKNTKFSQGMLALV